MAKVFRRVRAERSQFRKIRFGQAYWASSDVTVAPRVKYDRSSALKGYSTSTGLPTSDAVSPTTTAVVKVPRAFIGQPTRS